MPGSVEDEHEHAEVARLLDVWLGRVEERVQLQQLRNQRERQLGVARAQGLQEEGREVQMDVDIFGTSLLIYRLLGKIYSTRKTFYSYGKKYQAEKIRADF